MIPRRCRSRPFRAGAFVRLTVALALAIAMLATGVAGLAAAQGVGPTADVTLRLGVIPPAQLQYLRGETITYEACVQNPHPEYDMVVEGAEVETPDGVVHVLPVPANLTLQPGEQWCTELDWDVPVDYPCGQAVAELHAFGYQPIPDVGQDEFDSTVQKTVAVICPCIDVEKSADPTVSKPGDEVVYTITITNCSPNVGMESITVVDSLLGDISGSFSDTLAAGASESMDFPRMVIEGDPDPLVNTVTVTADPSGARTDEFTDTATATVELVSPCIEVTKTADPTEANTGDVITYTIEVCNCGDIDLENLTVVDSLLDDLSGSFSDTLAVGECESQTFTRMVEEGDPNPLINCVEVNADPLGPLTNDISDGDCAEVSVMNPCIDVDKTAEPTVSKVGDEVVYSIEVCNCGDVAMEGITVVDSLMGELSGSFVDTLEAGACESQTFPRTVMPGDADPLVNTVTVSANPMGPETEEYTASDTATVNLVVPGIEVTKTADPAFAARGTIITYTIEVCNTGDVGLENLTVMDDLMGDLSADFSDTLDIGECETQQFTREFLESDPTPLVNTVEVHADPVGPMTNDISDEDSAQVQEALVPSVTQWGIIAMVVLFGAGLVLLSRRRLSNRAV